MKKKSEQEKSKESKIKGGHITRNEHCCLVRKAKIELEKTKALYAKINEGKKKVLIKIDSKTFIEKYI